jgi:hypothetical protein
VKINLALSILLVSAGSAAAQELSPRDTLRASSGWGPRSTTSGMAFDSAISSRTQYSQVNIGHIFDPHNRRICPAH